MPRRNLDSVSIACTDALDVSDCYGGSITCAGVLSLTAQGAPELRMSMLVSSRVLIEGTIS